ncbi:hypothetical protein M0R04_11860 [Candidatus Dojkabacteria bacterium]|jgi:hypothetical protein|nr:hypothetical protein [Candidatus Dojkabacteria bacterium]
MKKYLALFVVVAVLLMVDFAFAQTPRDATSSEGKSSFTNLAVTGNNLNGATAITRPGTPGYIEMLSSAGNTYYLWIDYNGILKVSSAVIVGLGSSPAIVGWSDASGTNVATQK